MSARFIVGQHRNESRLLLTVCDVDIHGKVLEEGDAILDLSSAFFKGEEKSREETEKLILTAYLVHAIGKNAVSTVVQLGLAEEANINSINGVVHVQVLMI